jgi:protein TonB
MEQPVKSVKTQNQSRYPALIPLTLVLVVLFAFTVKQKTPESPVTTAEAAVEQEPDTLGHIHTVAEIPPEFPRGAAARNRFLENNLRYPKEARDSNIQGTVFVQFVVEVDGRITNVVIHRGVGGGLDEEAVRVVKMMPNWTPGRTRGKAVRTLFTLPIRFALAG